MFWIKLEYDTYQNKHWLYFFKQGHFIFTVVLFTDLVNGVSMFNIFWNDMIMVDEMIIGLIWLSANN